jgi:hypothetical protein
MYSMYSAVVRLTLLPFVSPLLFGKYIERSLKQTHAVSSVSHCDYSFQNFLYIISLKTQRVLETGPCIIRWKHMFSITALDSF